MIHPPGFSDSKTIHIKNGSAYHFTVGDTYLSRFKNSLRLEDKFENDDAFQDMIINVVNVEREKFQKRLEAAEPIIPIKTYHEKDSHDYDCYKFTLRKSRLSKKTKNLKKRENSNTKKNKVKQDGNDEKMKNIMLSIPPTIAIREDDPLFKYEDWDEYWIDNNKYEDTSDMYNDGWSTTSSQEEEYAFECGVERVRHMSRW